MTASDAPPAAERAPEEGALAGRVAPRAAEVSAVVVNFNGASYLPPCLDALLAQEPPLGEILVVDNASTDESLALMAERYPSVRVLALDDNGGPAVARNRGMEAARNRWCLALDNDVVVPPGTTGRLCQAASEHPAGVAFQPRSVFAHEPERVHYDGGALHYAGLITLRNWYRPLADAVGEGVVAVDCVVSLCLLVDKAPVLELGGYDPVYFILFEDLDLSCRLRLCGHELFVVEDLVVRHDVGTPGISFREGKQYPSSRVRFHSRNRWVYMAKTMRWRTLLLAAPGLLVYEAAWLGFTIAQGGLGAWAAGKREFLGLLGHVRHERRKLNARRSLPDRALLRGGPMTITPALEARRLPRIALRSVSGLMQAWWWVVRRLAG